METRNDLQAVLNILATSPMVTMSMGYKNQAGLVCADGILIHKAPNSIVSRLVKECVLVSMTDQGLHVPIKHTEKI